MGCVHVRPSALLRRAFALLVVVPVMAGLLGMHVLAGLGAEGGAESGHAASEAACPADCPPAGGVTHATDCTPAPGVQAPVLPAVVVLSRSDAAPTTRGELPPSCVARAPAPTLTALSISRT